MLTAFFNIVYLTANVGFLFSVWKKYVDSFFQYCVSNGKCRVFILGMENMWCDWAKLNVLQKRWLVCRLAALLILRSVGILSSDVSTNV
jgi:hypothetical protein